MTHITYYGHSCFMVEIGGQKLLFDPYVTENELASDIDIQTIKPDYILISHAHWDHLLDAEAIARNSGATIICNFEIFKWYEGKGFEWGEDIFPMSQGGAFFIGDNDEVSIKMVNAVHASSLPDGSYGGCAAGFVICAGDTSFYYSGDTALHYDMKLIGEAGGVDFAFLCLGDHFTMGIDDAAKAAQFVGTKNVIGMHFDTFPPIAIDHDKAVKVFKDEGLTLKLSKIEERFKV